MRSTKEASESGPFVICDKNYVFDNKLQIIPSGWDSPGDVSELSHGLPATFPSLKTFANLANAVYFKHVEDGRIIRPSKNDVQLEGFTFLAAANNSATKNGYYAVAYVNRETKQVILSHRGTVLSTIGALFTDLNGIIRKNFVPQVSSAITFAHKVVDFAAKHGFAVFFTGHSLGAWLAQITTFSTMYLTLDEDTGHFVGKQSPYSDVRMPYTVVFDSPGALNYLTLLKQALFHLQVESTQEISVEALPVEVFLFHPNYVNWLNVQIGRVLILDVAKADTKKYFGKGTHGMGPVVRLLRELREEDAVKWRVTDYRVGKAEMAMNSWDGKDRTVPWVRNTFPLYFFSKDERKFLEGAKRDFLPDGQFEGVDGADEETANSLVGVTNGNLIFKLTRGEESVVNCGEWNRREFIPRVRHIVQCLRQRGTLWWNSRRSQLPTNYVDRRMCPTAKVEEFTALNENEQKEQNEIKHFSASEILMKEARLVLFVDPPGMGKSSAMSQLEMQLRSEVSLSPRVILRLNLNRVQDILQSEDAEKEIAESQSVLRFIAKFVENIRVSLLQQTFPEKLLPLYVLLDGLDEVCPLYEQIMLRLLRRLLADTPQRLFSVHKVILTTRPHLQKLIEDAFNVQANSLLPLEFEEQVQFLKKEVGISFDAKKSLFSLPSTARSLMGNPLMLSLYAQLLKSHGTGAVVNIFDLYSQFVAAKHALHVVEKEEAEPAKMTTRRRVSSMLDDNLKFYLACAVHELLGSVNTTRKAILGNRMASELTEGFLEEPNGKKLDELISYGLLVSGCRFKHRSFAEFFYAQLLTHEAKEYKQFREVLFGRMYEDKVNENVERFLCEILLRRQAERRESPDSFPELCLREEEAASFLGKEKLARLVNGWIDSQKEMGKTLGTLLKEMEEPTQGCYRGPPLIRPFKNVGGELAGADDKESALTQFYRGRLFEFLCGRSVLLHLDYSHPRIFKSIKSDTFGLFWSWLCGLEDRSWVRAEVFGMNEEGVGHVSDGSAKVIRMFALRSGDVSKFLSDVEISAALNSLGSVVDDHRRVEAVKVEKYVDLARLTRSLLAHFTSVDGTRLRKDPYDEENRQEKDLECSWWFAEVFSRSDVLSFVSPYALRVPSISGIRWRAVQDAWGEEFVPPCERKILLRIKEGDLACLINLFEEVERGGLKLDGGLLDAVREMIFGEKSGWKVLEMLERRLVRHIGTNDNSCLSQEINTGINLLEQLFQFEDFGTTILDTLRLTPNLPLEMDSEDIPDWKEKESLLLKWLPFVVRYSGEPETIKRLSSYPKTLNGDNFASVARSFLLAHSFEATGSSSAGQLIRTFLRGLRTEPDSLLNVLLDADEGELRTLINENSPGTPPTVTHSPLRPLLIYLLHQNRSTTDESKSTPSWGLTVGSSLDAESVALVFKALIETSLCSELPGALGNFLSSFSPDLLKKALVSWILYKYFKRKRRVQFRKYVFVNTERICRLRATIRCYFVVFGEDLEWVEHGVFEDLLTKMPVEILSVLEEKEESTVEGFPPLQTGTKLNMVKKLEKKLRDKIKSWNTLSVLAKEFSYVTEADWERLLQALRLIPLKDSLPTGCTSAVVDHTHHYVDIVDSRVLLIRVWVGVFNSGAKETRRAADEEKLWEWLRDKEQVPRGEYLHVAVEVGSLEGVKTFAWPGLLKWTNEGGKTAGEMSVVLWGVHHEISQFLEERFQAVKAFHEEP